MLNFEFPETQGLELIRTSVILDAHGAKVSVMGKTSCPCACHSVPVMIRFVVKGKGNEDPTRLDWVERMIRGSNPKSKVDAGIAALEMTTFLVDRHMQTTQCCERKVS